ncbi:MAG: hypothetical protein OFPI_22310 [Osedax symbiont Rs2]|nr:MAG: hypothetical protein OFPI_22310 [Osedax symbiont Rs2]
MPNNFFISKVLPVLAILAIYGIGSFELPSMVFLPIGLSIAILLFYVTRKYGSPKEKTKTDTEQKK